jgi:NAD(P)H dehydrogenase (quinone)
MVPSSSTSGPGGSGRPGTTADRVVIIGGGPGGYESALVAAQLGAEVTVVDTDGIGGSAVLTDCVPSKTLIATAELMTDVAGAAELGVNFQDHQGDAATTLTVDLARVNDRVKQLAADQSEDIGRRLAREGVRLLRGRGRLDSSRGSGQAVQRVTVSLTDGGEEVLEADAVLVATGAAPRTLPTAQPDGERILTWEQVYDLTEVPTELIVVGSGVTGAEFASAYLALGIPVTLVSSRDRVLPGEDADAAAVLEEVLTRRGMTVLSKSRMESVSRHGDTVTVTLTDGRTVEGSHCILALGSVPNTSDMGLEDAGVVLNDGGFVKVDRVSRTSARGVYAAGDCTGVLMLASVAAMQGRIAMWHFLGDAVHPLDLGKVSSNVFTAPEIATVGVSQQAVDQGDMQAEVVTLPLSGNARAKMQGVRDGFVKLFCRPGTGIVVGGVVVGPRASELIHPVSLAVAESITADQLAQAFTVYPSMSGSIAEAARRLHRV